MRCSDFTCQPQADNGENMIQHLAKGSQCQTLREAMINLPQPTVRIQREKQTLLTWLTLFGK